MSETIKQRYYYRAQMYIYMWNGVYKPTNLIAGQVYHHKTPQCWCRIPWHTMAKLRDPSFTLSWLRQHTPI